MGPDAIHSFATGSDPFCVSRSFSVRGTAGLVTIESRRGVYGLRPISRRYNRASVSAEPDVASLGVTGRL